MPKPRLLLFAACERVIVDRETNNTSLISLLETLRVQVKKTDTQVPEDAVAPISWSILVLWQNHPENDKQWEQRVVVDLPQGIDMTVSVGFEQGKPNYRTTINVVGFPLGRLIGLDYCLIKLFLREQGTEQWEPISEYSIIVRHPEDN